MMTCKQASQLLSQGQDRSLDWRQRMGLRLHLMICSACKQFSVQMDLLRQAMREIGSRLENDEGIAMSKEARQRIVSAMQDRVQTTHAARQDPD